MLKKWTVVWNDFIIIRPSKLHKWDTGWLTWSAFENIISTWNFNFLQIFEKNKMKLKIFRKKLIYSIHTQASIKRGCLAVPTDPSYYIKIAQTASMPWSYVSLTPGHIGGLCICRLKSWKTPLLRIRFANIQAFANLNTLQCMWYSRGPWVIFWWNSKLVIIEPR